MTEDNENKTMLDKVTEAAEEYSKAMEVPPGYLEIQLTSNGKYGAPAIFHVKNFSTEDLVHLAVSDDAELPERTIEFLNSIVYEDVDVSNWHEKEVVETLFIIYKTFYQDSLLNLVWNYTPEDKEFLRQKYGNGSVEFNNRMEALETGTWAPVFDVDLNKVEFYPKVTDAKTRATIKKASTGFSCVYSWPRDGDVVKVKKYMDIIYSKTDKEYERLQKIAQFRKQAEQQALDGKPVMLDRIQDLTKEERDKLRKYEEEKLNFMTTCLRAIQLKEIRGTDVSELELKDRIKYAQDPELDFATWKVINKKFNEELEIGPKEEMTVYDPIIGQYVKAKVPFPVFALVQAIRDGELDGVDIDFD